MKAEVKDNVSFVDRLLTNFSWAFGNSFGAVL